MQIDQIDPKQKLQEITQILLKGIYCLKARQTKLQQTKLPTRPNQLDSQITLSTDNAVNNFKQSGL